MNKTTSALALSLALAASSNAALVTGLDGIADSSTMNNVSDWTDITGSVRSFSNGSTSGMIATSGSTSLWTAEYVSSDSLLANTEYTLDVRAGNWSPNQGAGTEFTIDIGYDDGGWVSLATKTFTGGTTGEISATTNGYDETLSFTTGGTVSGSVAVRLARTGTSGSWGGYDVATLDAVAVPEPSSSALIGLGGLALILRRKK